MGTEGLDSEWCLSIWCIFHMQIAASVIAHQRVHNWLLQENRWLWPLAEHAQPHWKGQPNCPSDNSRSFIYGSNVRGKSRGRIWGDRMHKWVEDTCLRFRKMFRVQQQDLRDVVMHVGFIIRACVCVSGYLKLFETMWTTGDDTRLFFSTSNLKSSRCNGWKFQRTC